MDYEQTNLEWQILLHHRPEQIRGAVWELFNARERGADNFKAELYRLIAKADPWNRIKLFYAFPLEVAVFKTWESSNSETDFYKKWGILEQNED